MFTVSFALQPKEVRQTILKERIKAAEDRKARRRIDHDGKKELFMTLPYYRITDTTEIAVCSTAFQNLQGIYRRQWHYLRKYSKPDIYYPGPIKHGNTSSHHRHSACPVHACQPSMKEWLTDLAETRGEAYATRFVREITSIGLQKHEEELIELPS